jgi:hypothetical protein
MGSVGTRPKVTAKSAVSQPMKIEDLHRVIRAAGGGDLALEYAQPLLEKIHRLEATGQYRSLMRQLRQVRNEGDLRGRVLEVNFADQFMPMRVALRYAVSQGMSGDIDFGVLIGNLDTFIETKLLTQDRATRDSFNAQIASCGRASAHILNDASDIARIQRDLILKSSTKKFHPTPAPDWINMVAIDIVELQLGMADVGDCVLAAIGNSGLAAHQFEPHIGRHQVVGLFEQPPRPSAEQRDWIRTIHTLPPSQPHPRDYIHGVLFLFRKPKDTAALSYQLRSVIVWNRALMTTEKATQIAGALYSAFPAER